MNLFPQKDMEAMEVYQPTSTNDTGTSITTDGQDTQQIHSRKLHECQVCEKYHSRSIIATEWVELRSSRNKGKSLLHCVSDKLEHKYAIKFMMSKLFRIRSFLNHLKSLA